MTDPVFGGNLKVTRLEGRPPTRFDCGRDDQNEFLHEHALHDQEESVSTTYLFSLEGLPAAYATVCMDALPLGREERDPPIRFGIVGAVKLAQLGVHRPFQGRGIGARAVAFVGQLARGVGERIACRYVTLDAQPDLLEWYSRLGFISQPAPPGRACSRSRTARPGSSRHRGQHALRSARAMKNRPRELDAPGGGSRSAPRTSYSVPAVTAPPTRKAAAP